MLPTFCRIALPIGTRFHVRRGLFPPPPFYLSPRPFLIMKAGQIVIFSWLSFHPHPIEFLILFLFSGPSFLSGTSVGTVESPGVVPFISLRGCGVTKPPLSPLARLCSINNCLSLPLRPPGSQVLSFFLRDFFFSLNRRPFFFLFSPPAVA